MEEEKLESRLTPVGVVECRNQNGELLFRRNNMIVSTGRQFIMTHNFANSTNQLYSCIGSNTSLSTANTNIGIFNEAFSYDSDNGSYSTASGAYIASPCNATVDISKTSLSIDSSSGSFVVTDESGNTITSGNTTSGAESFVISSVNDSTGSLTSTFKIFFTASNASLSATSLGLYYLKSNQPTLFSRVTFPPIQYSSAQALEFTYYIYF